MTTKARLLFVDDEERIVNLLRMIFRSNYEVYTATSGRQALEILSTQAIDVVVSDQRMPEMTGIELLSQVRKQSPASMRILLTGYSDLSSIVGSVNDGEVFRFINKPWGDHEIKAIIADAVSAAKATETISSIDFDDSDDVKTETGEQHAVLLLTDKYADQVAMVNLLEDTYPVYTASSITEALQSIESGDHNIGVIVADALVGKNGTGEFLRVLKQHHPEITTVMMTGTADADMVIKLINQVQVFRFATKPIRSNVFQLAVFAAMKENKRYRSSPALLQRHKVAASTEPENQQLVSSVLYSLKNLRNRFLGKFI
jgi:serine/threonine-protein kinase